LRQPITQVKEFKFASTSRTRRPSPEKEKKADPSRQKGSVSSGTESRGSLAAGTESRGSLAAGTESRGSIAKTMELKENGVRTEGHPVEEEAFDVAGDMVSEDMDEGSVVRMRAREIGTASILAWGETRGRYLDD
jgi:hypothetical protein